jgi:hypothetical protein
MFDGLFNHIDTFSTGFSSGAHIEAVIGEEGVQEEALPGAVLSTCDNHGEGVIIMR